MFARKHVPVAVLVQTRRGRMTSFVAGAVGAVVLLVAGAGLIGGVLPSIPNPFGSESVDRSQPPLLQSLVELTNYQAASANFQVIVDTEKDAQFLPSVIRGERTVFVAAGHVDAGVDFSRLDERSVSVSEDRRTATIALPPPALFEPHLDAEQSRVVSRERGVLDRLGSVFSDTPTSERPLVLAAEEKLRGAAAASDLRLQAEQNTRRMLEGMLRSLGFTQVNVTFAVNPA
ncbi:MAG: DUF4230 domain-containing protein [Actinomycetota bacterium]|nr:DUF4230 domain-containing protein [Actinomycetota bacterium]